MQKFFDKIKFWYSNSRPYSVPITFFSWLTIFVYSIRCGGSFFPGLLSLIGILLVHLATNLSDDYFDFQRLSKDDEFMSNSKEIKCRYLRDGSADISELRNVIMIMLGVAFLIGIILFFMSGWFVFVFAICVLPIAILYSKLSSIGLGDISVILAYGPFMYEGVYYVMTGELSWEVLVLSIACATFVNSILYAHMLMDFDEDVLSGKITLCTLLKTKDKALKFLLIFYFGGYIFISAFSILTSNYYCFMTLFTLPLVFELYKFLNQYNVDKTILFPVRVWHYPIENWNNIKTSPNASFLQRFMYTRNIAVCFMLIVCISFLIT